MAHISVLVASFVSIVTAYQFSPLLLNFTEAIAHCKTTYNSSLATILTTQQYNVMFELCSSNGIGNCWIQIHKHIESDDSCFEIKTNTQKTLTYDTYRTQRNRIACDTLLHPICNDPPISNGLNHGRQLLQTSDNSTSCNAIYDNVTCFISVTEAYLTEIKCNSVYPNCEMSISKKYPGMIHCPEHDCSLCNISLNGEYVLGFTIRSYNCTLVSVNVKAQVSYPTIVAPGNGGTLEITTYVDTYDVVGVITVQSTPGTGNIIFTALSGQVNTYIKGRYVSGDLNFTCAGDAYCGYVEITCGVGNSGCNIKCATSNEDSYDCEKLTVELPSQRESDANWYCDGSSETICLGAEVTCDDGSSQLRYDAYNQWYFATGDCVTNWVEPSLTISCSVTTADTCYIVKDYLDFTTTFQCYDDLPNCVVQLGDAITGDAWPELNSTMNCPSADTCDTCVINCISEEACSAITINGYNCTSLEVNIKEQSLYMDIIAPGNGGSLIINTQPDQAMTKFRFSNIYSSPGTKNMIFNFENWADGNIIDGTFVTDYLNVTCKSVCENTEITCPNDANCNILCDNWCTMMRVNAIEGTHDVNWLCQNDSAWTCAYALLNCLPDYSETSEWKYINGEWKLERYVADVTEWDYINHKYTTVSYNSSGCVDLATIAPTGAPTEPSIAPTTPEPSIPPTLEPTSPPTSKPSIPPTVALSFIVAEGFLNKTQFIGIASATVSIIIIVVLFIYHHQYKKREELSLYITNGLVILITIGEYEPGSDIPEIDGHLLNLPLGRDITHMVNLFRDTLNYDIYPSQYMNEEYSPKVRWTQEELNDFLVEKASYLEENIETYDGLIVIISSHGIPRYICTSDYKKFSKIAIHRIFSALHPKSRAIPRLFLYDCCSGSDEQTKERESESISECAEKNEEIGELLDAEEMDGGKVLQNEHVDLAKQISLGHVDGTWIKGEHNPDYKLAVIEAANYGFQSKLRADIGSYVIYEFYVKTMNILAQNQRRFIYKTFDEIQDVLHKFGKQHPTYVWNDNTRYIRFKKRKKSNETENESVVALEMAEVQQ